MFVVNIQSKALLSNAFRLQFGQVTTLQEINLVKDPDHQENQATMIFPDRDDTSV